MADKFTRFLQGVGQGLTNPKGNLGDARHAARLYIDNQYSRAPRTKFLYHVDFDINSPALDSFKFKETSKNVGMLVKQADLPKITIEHDIKNQYNRKRVVYKELKYEPMNITFHDDNIGIVNALWAQYLSYYSPERFHPQTAWAMGNRGPYTAFNSNTNNFRYGLDFTKGAGDAGTKKNQIDYFNPFFKTITLYTLSRKKFNSYVLINPHIVSWSHGQVDQSSSNGTVEAQMGIVYESILYGTGTIVKGQEPNGFADLYYDKVPSPLTLAGGTVTTVFGENGLLSGLSTGTGLIEDAKSIYGNLAQTGLGGPPNFFQAAIGAVNLYKSLRSINKETLIAEATNIVLSPGAAVNQVSGLAGVFITSKK